MVKQQTDAQLLDLLDSFPQEGMELLLDQYSPMVYRTVERRLSDPEDVKECVNDVFLEFYRSRHRYDPDKGSLETFLTAIARNLAVSRYRKSASSAETVPLQDAPGMGDLEQDTAERVDLERAMEKLSPEDAEIIRRKYYGGQTVQEIAATMGLPYETVKKRHQRSLKRLRALLTAGLILLLLALLAACAYLVLRHFGIIPGFGITGGVESPAYVMAAPVEVEAPDGRYSVDTAVYAEGKLHVEIRADLQPDAYEALRVAVDERGEYHGQYVFSTSLSIGGKTARYSTGLDYDRGLRGIGYDRGLRGIGYDNLSDAWRIFLDFGTDPPEDGEIQLSILGVDFVIPMERRDAASPESYQYAMGKYGGVLAIPTRKDGRAVLELYALNTSGFSMSRTLVWDAYMQGDPDAIALVNQEGEVLHARYRYDPAYNVTETMSLWDFGEIPPGEYTLQIPYVYLIAEHPDDPNIDRWFPLDLTTCSFSGEEIPISYGSRAVRSCEAVSGDDVPDWARDGRGDIPYSAGWLFTVEWTPPANADLVPSDLPINVVSMHGLGDQNTFRAEHAMDGNLLTLFYGCNGATEEELAQAHFSVMDTMSLLWDQSFALPLTIP